MHVQVPVPVSISLPAVALATVACPLIFVVKSNGPCYAWGRAPSSASSPKSCCSVDLRNHYCGTR